MKKILILFVLFSCMVVYGEEINIGDTKYFKTNNASSFDWTPYMQELEQTIKNNWHVSPNYNANLNAVMRFIIEKDGKIDNVEIYKSSGNPLFDRSAINAIKEISVFKPLPKEFKGDSAHIEYTFENKINISVADYSSYNNELSSKSTKLSSNKNGIYIQQSNYEKQNDTKTSKKIWASYMQKLEKTVRENWKSPIITSSKSATVQFKVSRNGDITEVKIKNSSNDNLFDESIVNAVKNTSPAEPLPEQFEGEYVPVELTLNSNTMGNNNSNATNEARGYNSPYNKHIINTYNMLSH